MSSPSLVDQGTIDKLTAGVAALTSLQKSIGSGPITDQHITALGSIAATLTTTAGELAAAIPNSRSAADAAAVAGVVDAGIPVFEEIFQEGENFVESVMNFFKGASIAPVPVDPPPAA